MQYWDVKETAGRTRTSEALWRKFIRLRQIPVVKIGRLVRLDPEAVRKFLEERTRPAEIENEVLSAYDVAEARHKDC